MKDGNIVINIQISIYLLHFLYIYESILSYYNLFRSDSTIVAPYERWQYYNENVKRINENKNYAENKTKQVISYFDLHGALTLQGLCL